MQPGVTVALAMVWLAHLVGVLSTSTPLQPFVDQYSPELPENRHGVARGPQQDLANRKRWRASQDRPETLNGTTLNDTPNQHFQHKIPPTKSDRNAVQDIRQDGRPRSFESDAYTEKSKPFNIELEQRRVALGSGIDRPSINPAAAAAAAAAATAAANTNDARKLQSERRKRTPDVEVLVVTSPPDNLGVDYEFGDNSYEYDDALKILMEDKKHRGDISLSEEEDDDVDIPLRGDIGIANTFESEKAKDAANATEVAKSISTDKTSASVIDVTASNGGRRLAGLQKREAIDFSRTVESPRGHDEKKEGAEPLRKRKSKDDGHKRRKDRRVLKRNQNNRRRPSDGSQGRDLMEYGERYRVHHQRVAKDEDGLEKKLQDYIRRNTPIDVRQNGHDHRRRNYEHRRREENRRTPHSRNGRRHQAPADYRKMDSWRRQHPSTRYHTSNPEQRHGQRRNHEFRPNHDDARSSYDRNAHRNHDRADPEDSRRYHDGYNDRKPAPRTEGFIERVPLNSPYPAEDSFNRDLSDDRHQVHNSRQPSGQRRGHDPRHRTQYPGERYDQRRNHDARFPEQNPRFNYNPESNYHSGNRQVDSRRQPYNRRQPYYQGHQIQDPRQPYNQQTSYNRTPYHDPGQPHDHRTSHDSRLTPRIDESPRQNHDQPPSNGMKPFAHRTAQDARQPNDSRQNSGYHYPRPNPWNGYSNNETSSPVSTEKPKDLEKKLEDYNDRNRPIDVRPYELRQDPNYRPGGVPIRNSNEPQQQRGSFSHSAPVDGNFPRTHSARNSTLGNSWSDHGYGRNGDERGPTVAPNTQNEHVRHRDPWEATRSAGRRIYVQQGDNRRRAQEQDRRYQEFRRNETVSSNDEEKYNRMPVEARIVIQPPDSYSRFKRDVEYAPIDPHHKGPAANRFPVPATKKPPVESPSLCIWAVIQCCPNTTRRKNCFEVLGCPEISWDPDPCRQSVRDAAREEINKFYAKTESNV